MTRLNPLNRILSALATLLTALHRRFSPPVAGARRRQQPRCRPSTCRPLAGQQLQLTLKLSGPAPQPTSVHHR